MNIAIDLFGDKKLYEADDETSVSETRTTRQDVQDPENVSNEDVEATLGRTLNTEELLVLFCLAIFWQYITLFYSYQFWI